MTFHYFAQWSLKGFMTKLKVIDKDHPFKILFMPSQTNRVHKKMLKKFYFHEE